jgi:hypothetical protein
VLRLVEPAGHKAFFVRIESCEVAAPITRRIGRILDGLWYAGSARETLMVLLALLAATMAVAAIFPQQPPGLQSAAAERWLSAAASDYAEFGQFLSRIGIFAIYAGPWLGILGGMLAFNVALRLAIQAATLAQLVRRHRNSSLIPGGRGDAEFTDDAARPTRATAVGALLGYAGVLILLAGLFLSGIAGWRATEIALAPGSSTSLGRANAPRLALEELIGSETDPIARIALSGEEDEDPRNAGWVAVGQPIRRAGLWIALRSAGPALQATARDSRGRTLLLQSLEPDSAGGLSQAEGVSEELHLLFQQTQAEQEFALPSANLSFRVVSYPSLPEQGIDVPVFLVEVYKGDEAAPTVSDLVVDSATIAVNGSRLELQRDRYAVVDVAYLPGLIPSLLGGLTILLGNILALWSTSLRRDQVESKNPAAKPDAEPVHAS